MRWDAKLNDPKEIIIVPGATHGRLKEILDILEKYDYENFLPLSRYVPAWANAQVPKTVDMFLSGIGRTGMRYVPVISFPRAM